MAGGGATTVFGVMGFKDRIKELCHEVAGHRVKLTMYVPEDTHVHFRLALDGHETIFVEHMVYCPYSETHASAGGCLSESDIASLLVSKLVSKVRTVNRLLVGKP